MGDTTKIPLPCFPCTCEKHGLTWVLISCALAKTLTTYVDLRNRNIGKFEVFHLRDTAADVYIGGNPFTHLNLGGEDEKYWWKKNNRKVKNVFVSEGKVAKFIELRCFPCVCSETPPNEVKLEDCKI